MQQFFHDLQGKLWDFLVLQFNKGTQLSNQGWDFLKPYFENLTIFTAKFFGYVLGYFNFSISFLKNILSNGLQESALIKPAFENLYSKNKYEAITAAVAIIGILVFWFMMLRHAKLYEIFRKKSWIAIIIVFGPFGALAYYFLRKRKLAKQEKRSDEVMVKFFSPMHKD